MPSSCRPRRATTPALRAVSGKVLFHRAPRSGSSDEDGPILFWDLEEREEKTILDNADAYEVSADGKKLLVERDDAWAIVDLEPGRQVRGSAARPSPAGDGRPAGGVAPDVRGRVAHLPRQLLRPGHARPGLGGGRRQLPRLLEDAVTRWDVNFVIGELIGEINASHTYVVRRRHRGAAGAPSACSVSTGRSKTAPTGSPASFAAPPGTPSRARRWPSPGSTSPRATTSSPSTACRSTRRRALGGAGRAGRADRPVDGQRQAVDRGRAAGSWSRRCDGDRPLRRLEWIEANRRTVDEATGGKVGYVYVPNTGRSGQTELVRQYTSQAGKDGLIVDERWNGGGQLPDRFVELMNRQLVMLSLPAPRGDDRLALRGPLRPQGDADQRLGRLGRRRLPVLLPRDERRPVDRRAHLGWPDRAGLRPSAGRRRRLHRPAGADSSGPTESGSPKDTASTRTSRSSTIRASSPGARTRSSRRRSPR